MALTEIPKELSSTPSIVDGGNATAITINADESVALANKLSIGTDSGDAFNPSSMIRVQTSGSGYVQLKTSTTDQAGFLVGDTDDDFAGGMIYSNNTDSLSFHANNAERMRILPTGGITFNGDTAAANALDDYEEGTWTPAVAGMGITTTRAVYTKIGRLVQVDFTITVSSIGTGSSTATITGIPFISASNANSESAGSVMLLNFNAVANTCGLNTYVYSRSQGINIYQTRSNVASWVTVKANDLTVGSAIIGSITYVAT